MTARGDGAIYRPRHIRYVDLTTVGEWRIKTYSIALTPELARSELRHRTITMAADCLPGAPFEDGRHGAGFTIAHDAATVCFGLVYWWQSENELYQRLFMAPKDNPAALSPIEHPAAGCVWELGVIDFERRAWLADMMANPSGPDLPLYLSRRTDATF